MGMGISQKIWNGDGREWELNRWELEGMGMLKAIPAHLYVYSDSLVVESTAVSIISCVVDRPVFLSFHISRWTRVRRYHNVSILDFIGMMEVLVTGRHGPVTLFMSTP